MALRLFFRYWCVFGLSYMLLITKHSMPEVISGILAAAVSAFVMTAIQKEMDLRLQFRAGWLPLIIKQVPLQAIKDCFVVPASLWTCMVEGKRPQGYFISIPFDPGGDDGESAARRALIITAITLAPNSIAISIDREKNRLLVHRLVPSSDTSEQKDPKWPL